MKGVKKVQTSSYKINRSWDDVMMVTMTSNTYCKFEVAASVDLKSSYHKIKNVVTTYGVN